MDQKIIAVSIKNQQGIVLLESLIAVLIFSFGIIALLGLQATMIRNASGSEYRSEAIFIAQQRIGVLWADPAKLTDYAESNVDISSLLPNGKRTVIVNPPPVAGDLPTEVIITITWQLPGEQMHSYTTNARVTGTGT